MDPFSISVGALAIIQTAFKLTVTVSGYLRDVKDAPKDKQKLLAEVLSLQVFFTILKAKAEGQGAWHKTLESLAAPKGPLEQFKMALEGLVSKLQPADSGLQKWRKAAAWPFQKKETKDILSILERHKILFVLAVQDDHM
jgi:hypothetical protein